MKKNFFYITGVLLFSLSIRAQTSFGIQYALLEETIASNAGAQFPYLVTYLNSAYTSAHPATINWAEVRYDSLINFNYNTGAVINAYPLSSSTVRIDSFSVFFAHVNRSGTNNAITFTIYRGGSPTGETGHSGTVIWTQTVNTSVSLSAGVNVNGVPNPVSRTFYPGITLPQGQYFSIRLGFTGSVAQDTLFAISGYRDNCSGSCVGVPSSIPNSACYLNGNSGRYLVLPGVTPVFYDCNGNTTYDANLCEDHYLQDFVFTAYITVTSNLNFSINPTASANNLCTPQNVTLSANVTGGIGPFSYTWSNGSTSSSPAVYVSSTATYSVTVIDQGSAQSRTGSVTVNMRNISVNAGSDQTVSCPTAVTLSASVSGTTTGVSYQWSNGSASSSTIVSPSFTTDYSVTVSNSYGCTAMDYVTVICSGGGCNPPSPAGYLRFTPGYDLISCINQNQAYNQTVYFEAPYDFGGLYVNWVRIDSIRNLPCGISWTTSPAVVYGGSLGCITFSGTTSDVAGGYKLQFYLTTNLQTIGTISGELSYLLNMAGEPDVPYYLKVKASASSCQSASSLTSRNSPCGSAIGGDNYLISQEGTHTVCTGNFYDSGGPLYDYFTYEDYTITFTSGTSQQIAVDFISFRTESGYDYLRVYDGTSTFAPLINSYSGSSIPSTVTSTSGSLTFRFTSDGSGEYSGWQGSISCISLPLSVTADDFDICKGESVQLQAYASGGTGSYTYSWSPSAALVNPASANPIATPLNTTTYTVTVSDGANSATATATVTIHNPPSVDAGPDQYISDCFGTTTLTATSNDVIADAFWDNGADGLTNFYAHQGTNTIFVIDNYGCTAFDQVNVYLTGSRQIISFTAPPTACAGNAITFSNTSAQQSGWTWRWDFGDGTSSTTSNAIHTYNSTGYYTVTLRGDSSTCQLFHEAEISITQCSGGLSVSISGSTQACEGSTTILTAIVSGGSGNYTYSWSPAGFPGSSTNRYSVSPYTTMTFSVYVADNAGNSNVASHTVTVKPSPNADAGEDTYICPGGLSQLSVSTDDGIAYSWQPSAGLSCVTCPNPAATPSVTTTYTVAVTGSNGCIGYDEVTVNLSPTAPASVTISTNPDPFCGSQSVQLTANIVNGGTNPAISWKRNGTEFATTGTTSGQFAGGDIITVDITSNLACANPKSATYTITVQPCVGVDERQPFGDVIIYPNPNGGRFLVLVESYNSPLPLIFELFTIDGRRIYHEAVLPQADIRKSLEFGNLHEGLYLLRISNEAAQMLKRVVVSGF